MMMSSLSSSPLAAAAEADALPTTPKKIKAKESVVALVGTLKSNANQNKFLVHEKDEIMLICRAMMEMLAMKSVRWASPLVYVVDSGAISRPSLTINAHWINAAASSYPCHSAVFISLSDSGFLSIVAVVTTLATLIHWTCGVSRSRDVTCALPFSLLSTDVETMRSVFSPLGPDPASNQRQWKFIEHITPPTSFDSLFGMVHEQQRNASQFCVHLENNTEVELATGIQEYIKAMTGKNYINFVRGGGADRGLCNLIYFIILNSIIAANYVVGGELQRRLKKLWVDFESVIRMKTIGVCLGDDQSACDYVRSGAFDRDFAVVEIVNDDQVPGDDPYLVETLKVVAMFSGSSFPAGGQLFCVRGGAVKLAHLLGCVDVVGHRGDLWTFRGGLMKVIKAHESCRLSRQLETCAARFGGKIPEMGGDDVSAAAAAAPLYGVDESFKGLLKAFQDHVASFVLRPTTNRLRRPDGLVLPDIEDLAKPSSAAPLCVFNSIGFMQSQKRLEHLSRVKLFQLLASMGYSLEDTHVFVEKSISEDDRKTMEYKKAATFEFQRIDKRQLSCAGLLTSKFDMGDSPEKTRGCPFQLADPDDLLTLLLASGMDEQLNEKEISSILKSAQQKRPKVACLMHGKAIAAATAASAAAPAASESFPFDSPSGRFHFVLNLQQKPT
jgi:hypothetical protein